MTFKLFWSRYGKLFLKNLKNPLVGLRTLFFVLLGCENLPKEKTLILNTIIKGGGKQTMFMF